MILYVCKYIEGWQLPVKLAAHYTIGHITGGLQMYT